MNDIDSQIWHACAGEVGQMPLAKSKTYYFAQGHAEHAQSHVDFSTFLRRIPPLILCRVSSVKYRAAANTDEVFSIIRLMPLRYNKPDYCEEEDGLSLGNNRLQLQEKPAPFAKVLTQSDANNGGGFSVPRHCAEKVFPKLDYESEPPVQMVLVKDVHGKIWEFRHIYRGTPKRHLLTTGWSNFVNEKKLVAGDTVAFFKTKNGDICVGIRRINKGVLTESTVGWNHSAANFMYGGFSGYLIDEESKLIKQNNNGGSGISFGSNTSGRGKLQAESVIEAATLAASGKPFEVVYYPRTNAPAFCVMASAVGAAMRIQWCSGMRIKMAFEEEDSKISCFMGTISTVQDSDPIWWPGSPWRLLQVSWDDSSTLLQNVNCVSPWLVEPILNMPTIQYAPFLPTSRKPIPHRPDLFLDSHLPASSFSGNPHIPSGSTLYCLPLDGTPVITGIQGARQSQYGISLLEHRIGERKPGLFHARFHQFNDLHPYSRISTGLILSNSTICEEVVSSLTGGNPPKCINKDSDKECNAQKKIHFMLFGTPILAEQQLSLNTNCNLLDGSGSAMICRNAKMDTNSSSELLLCCNWDKNINGLGLEIGHCKVFKESENLGRTLDLSALSSYEQLYCKLANMFAMEDSELSSRILYRDTAGAVKHIEDEPFAEFKKVARRLMILMDSSSDDGK